MDIVGTAFDGLGVVVLVVGALVAGWRYFVAAERKYRQLRQDLGRAILLGLEFLVAADIIRTVAISPTLESVLTLGLIVLIRTFLSLSLELELEGRLPWKRAEAEERERRERAAAAQHPPVS